MLGMFILLWILLSHQPISFPPSQPVQTVQPGSPVSYPVHTNITATVFWVGEAAGPDNDYIQNRSSAWMADWMGSYGGVDARTNRCGYRPCSFTPRENAFYFALPYNDLNGDRPKSNRTMVPWLNAAAASNQSQVKNRWVRIQMNDKVVYAQWEDVGPYNEDDGRYVFSTQDARPKEKRAGIDLSPATANYLQMGDVGSVSWRFVEAAEVPDGPWKQTVTTVNTRW